MDTKAMRCPCSIQVTPKPIGPRRDPPCVGSNKSYADCCGHYLDNGEIAPTAEALMRSRYTAYTLGREDYLLVTWHYSTRPASLAPASKPLSKWLGLEVSRHEQLEVDYAVVGAFKQTTQ